MDLLFVHQNFPGQFRHLALALAAEGPHRVVAMGQEKAPGLPGTRGLTMLRYAPKREPTPQTHAYLRGTERAVIVGQSAARAMLDLKRKGFSPRVIVSHPGWGETLYARDVFPDARVIHFCEFYYHPSGVDVGFDPAFPVTLDDQARIRTRNALHLLNLEQCDAAVTPTAWQQSLHPAAYRPKLRVIHEGIDTDAARPDPAAAFTLPDGRVLTRADPVVSYVARNLEPYRGYPQFVRALHRLQQRHPQVHALILGGDEVSYGTAPKDHPHWRAAMAAEVALDPARTHHLGRVPHARYLQALQVATCHVYLTYPFVLSWSMLEAMACGAHVIGSATPPVQEVIRHGDNGWLTDFFDTDALADAMATALADPPAQDTVRQRARETVLQHYRREDGTRAWRALIDEIVAG